MILRRAAAVVAGALPALALFLLLLPGKAWGQVPTLNDLAGEWVPATHLRDMPAISNWRGTIGTNVDVVDASSFIAPPFVAGPSMLALRVDGRDVVLEATKWSAYKATRRGRLLQAGGQALVVTSELRMAWNDTAVLWTLTLEHGDGADAAPVAAAAKNGTGTDGEGGQKQQEQPQEERERGAAANRIQQQQHTLEFSVQAQARALESMGWLVFDPPQNLSEFNTRVLGPAAAAGASQRAMVLHEDTLSDAVSGFVFVDQQPSEWAWMPNLGNPNASAAVGTLDLTLLPGQTATVRLVAAMGSAKEEGGLDGMARRLEGYAADFDKHWDAARAGWERVWEDAFVPRRDRGADSPGLFSGHLPVLTTADDEIRRLYYMGALTLLTMGRTSVRAFNDDGGSGHQQTSYLTAFGNTCWTGDDTSPSDVDCRRPSYPRDTALAPVYIGATAQFYWDTSLRALLTSLLDPAALRRYILTFMSLGDGHFEASFGLDALNGAPIGYEYAFNAHSIFTIVGTYLRATNDTGLLAEVVGDGVTVNERLEAVAMDWVRRRIPVPPALRGRRDAFLRGSAGNGRVRPLSSSGVDASKLFLSDYGGNVANLLECVPTYLHATPGLQAGNAEMMAWMARLRAAQGNATGAQGFRDLVRSVALETVQQLYVPGGNGTWGCMYQDGTVVPVRHVIDFIYVSRGLAVATAAVMKEEKKGKEEEGSDANTSRALAAGLRPEMAGLFHRELETPTWIRALSLEDELNQRTPRSQMILRPDHGITGAFDAWAALAAEALAINEGGWDGALTVLRHMSAATKEGPFGQAHELDSGDATTFKTIRGWTRFAADNGASFSDVVIRGLFGFQPAFYAQRDPSLPYQGLEHALAPDAALPRGDLRATLANLPTPWGDASLELGADGVRITGLKR